MLQMERCSHWTLKVCTAKLWELGSRSLGALQLFVASHSAWFRDVIIIDRSYINATFDNRRLAGQHGGRLVTGEVQTQLRKDKQRSKDKQASKDEQRCEETGVEKANKIEDKQRGEETEMEEVNELDKPSRSSNELDEPSESSGSDCLFMPIV